MNITTDRYSLTCGDCIDGMRAMPENSVDGLVTDPPAGVKFMGKGWDDFAKYQPRTDKGRQMKEQLIAMLGLERWAAGFVAFTHDWAVEALRVLKPGAPGLVWALPRSSDLTGLGLRSAGFDVRDNLYHIFSTGFPKNHDISKAIDRIAGAEREVIGTKLGIPGMAKDGRNQSFDSSINTYGKGGILSTDITAPATDAARLWAGYGTALKPSCEEWLYIRKPLDPQDVLICEVKTLMEAFLWFLLPVQFVEMNLPSSPAGQRGALDTALLIADALSMLSKPERSAMMDMFKSPGEASTFLSIGWLWSGILGAHFSPESRSTTKTGSDLITGLKILRSYLLGIMPPTIIRDATNQNGSWLNALAVGSNLNENAVSWLAIHNAFAPKLASESMTKSVLSILASVAENHSLLTPANDENSALCNALTPGAEEWILVMKPMGCTYAENAARWGVAGINVDGCRIGTDELTPRNNKPGQNGWKNSSGGYIEPSPLGRWPSHLLLDESAAELLDQQSGESKSSDRLRHNGAGKQGYNGNPNDFITNGHDDSGGASRFFTVLPDAQPRFFYTPKASTSEKQAGLDGHAPAQRDASRNDDQPSMNGGAGNPYNRGAQPVVNNHPTPKSTSLMRWLVKLVKSPTGGKILDPFAGSGSTGIACLLEGCYFVGFEKESDYYEIARRRLEHWEDEASTTPRRVKGNETDINELPLFAEDQ